MVLDTSLEITLGGHPAPVLTLSGSTSRGQQSRDCCGSCCGNAAEPSLGKEEEKVKEEEEEGKE